MLDKMDLDLFDDYLLSRIIQKMDTASMINFKKACRWTDPFVTKMGKQATFRIPHEIHINAYLDDDNSVYFIINHLKFNKSYSFFRCSGPLRYIDAETFERELCVNWRGLRFRAIRFYGLWKEADNSGQVIKSLENITSSLSKYNIQCEEISFNRVPPTASIIQILRPTRLEVNCSRIFPNNLEIKLLKNMRKMTVRTEANGDVLQFCRGLTECRVDITASSLPVRDIMAFVKEMESTHNSLRLIGILDREALEKAATAGGFVLFPGRGASYLVHSIQSGVIVIRCDRSGLEARRIQAADEIQQLYRKFCHIEEISTREEIAKKYFN